MHEATVVSRILDTVQGYRGLRAVFVAVGRGSCVHPDMLRDAFDMAKQGTSAGFASLVAVTYPGEDITVLSVEVEDAQD